MAFDEKGMPPAATGGERTVANSRDENIPGAAVSGNGYSLVADRNAIREALIYFRGQGPYRLHSVGEGSPFESSGPLYDVDAAASWAVSRNAERRNVYLALADVDDGVGRTKAKDAHVTKVGWVWADLDPAKDGLPVPEQRPGLLAKLGVKRPAVLVAPSAILDSGGGYWGFWRLAEPLPPDDARKVLCGVADTLESDRTFDPSRIARLAGTVNWPDDAKRQRGQIPAVARLISATDATVNAAALPLGDPKASKGASGPVTAAPARDIDPATLPVSDKVKQVIVQGCDPDEAGWLNGDRSRMLWHVLLEMARAGCDEATMLGVTLDRSFGISAHVYKDRQPETYARRQVRRAQEEAIAPELRELNDRHAVLLNEQGKTRVMEYVPDQGGREAVSLQTFEDFRNRYMNRQVVAGKDRNGGEVEVPLGAWWLRHKMRRQHHSLVFAPGKKELVGDRLNLWRGFGVTPRPGDWSLMQAHIRDVLAGGDEAAADYIRKWAAFAVQHPDQPAEVALVFRGAKGTGKGIFARALAQIFGQHGFHIDSTRTLTGRFNLHLRDCCLLFADEVEWSGNREAEANLKRMITEPTLHIEGKGTNSFSAPNFLHIVIASNEEWVVPASIDERRFAAFAVSDAQQGQAGYFDNLVEQMNSGGLAAMLHDLLVMDLGKWHPRSGIPETGELMAQKLASLSGAAAVVLELLTRGETPYIEREGFGRCEVPRVAGEDEVFIPTGDLATWALAKRLISEVKPGLTERLGHELKKAGGEPDRESVHGKQVRGFWMPALPVARQRWAEARRLHVDWGEGDKAAWDVAEKAEEDEKPPF